VVLEEEVAWEEVKVLLVGVVEGVAMWTGVSTRSKKNPMDKDLEDTGASPSKRGAW
jgi:hypothetical protein